MYIIDLTGHMDTKKQNRYEYYQNITSHLPYVLTGCLALGFYGFFFPKHDESNYEQICFQIIGGLTITAAVFTIQKFCVQLIAVKFHRTAYDERLNTCKHQLETLDTLKGCINRRSRKGRQIDMQNTAKNIFRPKPPRLRGETSCESDEGAPSLPPSQTQTLSSVHTPEAIEMEIPSIPSITPLVTAPVDNVAEQYLKDRSSNMEAKKLAKRLFNAIASGPKEVIMPSDFEPWYSKDSMIAKRPQQWQYYAREVFAMFDRDGNGDISKMEMKNCILDIFREKRDLARSVRDLDSAVGKLNDILSLVSVMLLVVFWMMLFNNSATLVANLVSLGSVFLALSFIFGGTAKNLFDGVIFLFCQHPYDVGDRIFLDSMSVVVKAVDLLQTTFTRWDGQLFYVPNAILATKMIYNCRRSPPQMEVFEVDMAMDTPNYMLSELRAGLVRYLEVENRFFLPNLDIMVYKIENANQIQIQMCLQYKTNWQDHGMRWRNRSRFLHKLREVINETGIVYYLPNRNVTMEGSIGVDYRPERSDLERGQSQDTLNQSVGEPGSFGLRNRGTYHAHVERKDDTGAPLPRVQTFDGVNSVYDKLD